MKRFFLLGFLLSLVSNAHASPQATHIGGMVRNPADSVLKIADEVITLGEEGRFVHHVILVKPSYIPFELNGKISFFISPGDSLSVTLDATHFYESMAIHGRGAEVNRFLLAETHKALELNTYVDQNFKRIASQDEAGFTAFVDSVADSFHERIEDFLASHDDLPEEFAWSQNAILKYSTTKGRLDYIALHRHATGEADFWPSQDYFAFLTNLDFNDSRLWELEEYRAFLARYVEVKAEERLKTSHDFDNKNYKEFRAKLDVIISSFTDPNIRDEMAYPIMKELLSECYIKGLDDLLSDFRGQCSNPQYLQHIDKIVAYDMDIQTKCEIQVFKTVDGVTLDAFVYKPDGFAPGDARPAVAFFHGGGWYLGKPEWGDWQCSHFASLGLVAISFEYRLKGQHDVTPVECITDARSALRWMRQNAYELGLDPDRIVASGFSAGGHIALCTTMLDRFDEPGEDLTVSPAANAFLLWVTPAKIFSDGWFKELLRDKATVADCDPAQHIRPDLPPCIMFQGTEDNDVPVWSIKEFAKEMKQVGNRCDLFIYEGQTHLGWGDNGDDVLAKMDQFLVSLGYLGSE